MGYPVDDAWLTFGKSTPRLEVSKILFFSSTQGWLKIHMLPQVSKTWHESDT